MIQFAILILSGAALFLSIHRRDHWSGPLIGVIGQPLWIYETWPAQWGMFALSVWFFGVYAWALWKWWRRQWPVRSGQLPPRRNPGPWPRWDYGEDTQ